MWASAYIKNITKYVNIEDEPFLPLKKRLFTIRPYHLFVRNQNIHKGHEPSARQRDQVLSEFDGKKFAEFLDIKDKYIQFTYATTGEIFSILRKNKNVPVLIKS